MLSERYRAVRAATEAICAPLTIEDHVVQAFPDASPARWHLAHTTWFFERMVLASQLGVPGHRPFHPQYDFLFNSYYDAVGPRVARDRRGTLSRPTVADIRAYRRHVDAAMTALFEREEAAPLAATIELGLHHEQQHQELLFTDVLAAFACNPLRPVYRELPVPPSVDPGPPRFVAGPSGVHAIGHPIDEGADEFAFDNERPRHRVFLEPFAIASRPATNAELLSFVEDDGYRRSGLWLSEGFRAVQTRGWAAPRYWERRDGAWWTMTLGGMRPLDPHAPACHLSEAIARSRSIEGNFADRDLLVPASTSVCAEIEQLFGDVWEWTASAYAPYPGFRPLAGALGEYNGKFMSGQMVLRGGSCLTPRDHVRATYRNFFPPDARWQMTGARLARSDVGAAADGDVFDG
ncbi:MAG: ergothioneine biosynthesis protein EgtB [Deltaproteobacteria bacterium]|nr:ergothioneine biosynthesis protein EgtB [Deltaproteobacteria bacterium]